MTTRKKKVKPKFKVGDEVVLKPSASHNPWIYEGVIETITRSHAIIRATKVSDEEWLHDEHRETIQNLYTDWELNVTSLAKRQFDDELKELLK